MSVVPRGFPARMRRLALPERTSILGCSLSDAEQSYEIFAGGEELLNLTYANTKRFPAPPWVIDDFVAAALGGGASYTPYRGDAGVCAEVAPAVSAFLGLPIDPEREMVLTAGTQAGLFGALSAVVEAGDRVLLVDPDYLCTERILRFLDAEVDHVPLAFGAEEPRLDLDHLEQGFKRGARILVLSHPNNPTGIVYDEATVRRSAELACDHDALVLVDQLYSRLIFDGKPFYHLIGQPGMKQRCITLLGPSKTESMSGYRIGVLVGPTPLVSAITELQGVMTIRAPAYSQHTIRRWLSDDAAFVDDRVRAYQTLRDMTIERLSALEWVNLTPASGTAYLFPDVSALKMKDLEIARSLLSDAKVIINPGFQFGPRGVGCLRLCFAQEEAAYEQALIRIVAVLAGLAADRAVA
jgi:aspartate/methionine/tyrosine aminotransferase